MTMRLQRRRFSVNEYRQMAETGILSPRDRVELIRGEIVEMSPIGRRHAACVRRLIRLLARLVGDHALLDVQDPVELDDQSEPQPDLVLLRPCDDFYESGHPQAEDIFLVIEVADTTVDYDREVKIPAYAEDGVLEAWLVDINGQCIERYREPTPTGYRVVQQYGRGETLSIQELPGIAIAVNDVLG